ncbi:MAG: rhomboid family intramembrane serine protease [Thermoanaerobaculia bacterium]|nr:rhomboid family intramembrane serine protease [Thermoanaerobaculia bacterium]
MDTIGIITLLLILANLLVSYQGFKDHRFLDKYAFEVDSILVQKDYQRLFTSGFLHVGWTHLLLNMLSLYAFADHLQAYLGRFHFCIVYVASLLGGNLLSLYLNRNNGDYSAVGASGAVCGVIFASIAVIPGIGIGFLGFGYSFPGWIYGVLFVLYSIYGIKSQRDNIGHEAHLGGALVGMAVGLAMHPQSLPFTYKPVLAVSLLSAGLLYLVLTRPHLPLLPFTGGFFSKKGKNYTLEDRYNASKQERQKEIDRILEKVHKSGVGSLTKQEKEMLDEGG